MATRVERVAEIESYSSFQNYLSCSAVQDIEYEYRCDYVKNTTECREEGYYFNYIDILYCYLKPTSDRELYIYMTFFVLLAFVMLWFLGATASKYFCPALLMLSKALGLSEHVAGITLLAIGNGSTDLFRGLVKLNSDPVTLFSNALSAAIFVLAFVGGVVCIVHPFHVCSNSILRDTMFLLLAILCINWTMRTGSYLTLGEAICFFSIYFIYLAVILIDLYLIKRNISLLENAMFIGSASFIQLKRYRKLKQHAEMDILPQEIDITIDEEALRRSSYGSNVGPNKYLIKQLLISLNPINDDNWSNGGCCTKALTCFTAPMNLSLALLIPSADFRKERHGWSKLLNSMQVVTLPFITFCSYFHLKSWFGIPIFFYTLIFTIPVAYFVFKSSRTDSAPKFHKGFACLAAYGSVFVIYSCAAEIMSVFEIMGVVTNSSSSFVGCTLLTWATSIGDLVSNTSLALHGYHKMAFAACIGGLFFSIIVCLGLILIFKTMAAENNRINLTGGPMGTNCIVFLVILLMTTLLWSTTTNFKARRSVGIFYLMVYFLFFLYTVLYEWDVIQTFAEIKEYGFDIN